MLKGLPPIEVRDARLLILGSMPSEASLHAQQYYAYRHNAFWKIMTEIFGPAETYPQKVRLLKKNKIALWDVIGRCQRMGSLDSDIKDATYNDIGTLLKKHTKIRRILLNGGLAYTKYVRYANANQIALPYLRLPSTSPAHTMSFKTKLKIWSEALR